MSSDPSRHREGGPGDVRCLLGGQEEHRVRDLFDGAEALHGDHVQEALLVLLGEVREQVRIDEARRDAVDGYLAARDLLGEGVEP